MRNLDFYKKIEKCIPRFQEDNITYKRKEKRNYISVHSARAPWMQEIFLNFTMQKVLTLCDGYTSVEKIVDIIYRLYDYKIDKNQIKIDTVNGLEELTICKLIDWKEGDPFMKKLNVTIQGQKFSLVEENDIRELMKFTSNKIGSRQVRYIHLMSDQDVYKEEIYIRDRLFNFTEDFYILRNNEKIIGLISLLLPKNKSTVSTIGILIAESSEDEKILIENLLRFAKEVTAYDITKTKFQFSSADPMELKLPALGFIKECVLRSEIGTKDVRVYSYFYEDQV